MMKKYIFFVSLAVCLCLVLPSMLVSAESDSASLDGWVAYSYNYDVDGKPFKTLPYYTTKSQIAGDFSDASDIVTYKDKLYVLTQHGIDVFDLKTNGKTNTVISNAVDFKDAKGMFITSDGRIFLTQYEKQSVVITDLTGEKLSSFGAPKSALISKDFIFKPTRIAVQDNGLIYVVSEGAYDGLVQFDKDGKFISFFGANKVSMTAELLLQQFWNKFRTQEQIDRTVTAVPTSYSSLCVTKDDLIYVCSDDNTLKTGQIRKLSPYGNDITPTSYGNTFGDAGEDGKILNSFKDVAVDENGIVTVLDGEMGRVFQYDSVNHLLGVFGGISNQKGTFQKPVAIDNYNENVIVLDIEGNAISIFSPTEYGTMLRTGSTLYLNGKIQDAAEYFEKINNITGNLAWVSSGLGQAALEKDEFRKGMAYFKAAMDTDGYSQCLEAYRSDIIGKSFWIIFSVVVLLLVALWIWMTKTANREEPTVYELSRTKMKPWYVLGHPASFVQIKEQNRGSVLYAAIVFGLSVITRILALSLKGFAFNPTKGINSNYFSEILQFALIFVSFVACVWAVGTFIEGKGKVKDLCIAYAYALTPYVVCGILSIALSNVMTLREAVFVTGIETIGIIWTAVLIFSATLQLNEYSFSKTVVSLLLTLLAIVFILFVLILLATLIGKMTSFITQLIEEANFKM